MIMIDRLIEQALLEDIHTGDITTLAVVPGERPASARLIAKENLVVAGLSTAARVFSILDPEIRFKACLRDGEKAAPGTLLATVHGEREVAQATSRFNK